MKDLLRVHLGIMISCAMISWTALCLHLKPFPVKALAVSCEERLLETQNFDCLLLPGTCVKAPLSYDTKIFTLLHCTYRSCGCSVVVGIKLVLARFREPGLAQWFSSKRADLIFPPPLQRKLEWGTFFKTCRELADWIAVTLRRSPNVCMPFLGFDLIDGMGIQKVGCVKINAETLCVFELASASSWTNGRPTFLWQTSLLVHLCLPASISSGALTSLGMRLQLFDKNGPADLLPLLCALWFLLCHGEVGGDDSPLASLLSCGLGDIDALWRDLREGEHCEPFFSDDACCGSGGSNQPHVCDMPAMELDGGSHFEDSGSCSCGGLRVSGACCGCSSFNLPYCESARASESSCVSSSFLNPSSRKKNSRDDGQDKKRKRDKGQDGFASELFGGSHFDFIVSCLTGWNEIVVSSCDEDVHVCQVTANNLENRLFREREIRMRTSRFVKQLGVSDEQFRQAASVGSKVGSSSLVGSRIVHP